MTVAEMKAELDDCPDDMQVVRAMDNGPGEPRWVETEIPLSRCYLRKGTDEIWWARLYLPSERGEEVLVIE